MKRFAGLLPILLLLPSFAFAAGSAIDPKAELAQIELTTQQIRQLKPTHAVHSSFLANAAFDAAFNQEVRQGTPDAEVALNQRESVELGLLARGQSLHQILFANSAAQFSGFYDYHSQRLFVRNDANKAFGPERYVLAHEYTHALQDQHFHLLELLPDQFPLQYRNSDAVAAHHALTEGDAVVLENAYIHQTYSRKELNALVAIESQASSAPPLPKAIRRQLYFPYTTGVDFATSLYRQKGFAGIDAAYRRLPASTYEIMHPDAYLKHWKPVEVLLHSVQGFSDWQQLDDDVFGAFGYDLLFWQFGPKKQADAATVNYRGDRYLFLEKGTDNLLLLKSVWTTGAAAKVAKLTLIAGLKARYPHALIQSGASTVVVSSHLSVYLKSVGPMLTVSYAPSEALATQLGTATTT